MKTSFLGLPGRTMQWVFDKGSHLTLVASGAEQVMGMTNDALVALALHELREALPETRNARVQRVSVVRERRATFSLAPGQPKRPSTRTNVKRIVLAATGSIRVCPRRSKARRSAVVSPPRPSHELRRHPLSGNRAEGTQPSLVHRAARAQYPDRDQRPRHAASRSPRWAVSRSSCGSPEAWEPVAERLRHVFGIANFSRAGTARSMSTCIANAILDDLGRYAGRRRSASRRGAPTNDFRSRRRRSSAKSAVESRKRTAGRVDLDEPELTIHVEVMTDEAFYHFGKEPGRRHADRRRAAASSVCCRAASIRRSPRIG